MQPTWHNKLFQAKLAEVARSLAEDPRSGWAHMIQGQIAREAKPIWKSIQRHRRRRYKLHAYDPNIPHIVITILGGSLDDVRIFRSLDEACIWKERVHPNDSDYCDVIIIQMSTKLGRIY